MDVPTGHKIPSMMSNRRSELLRRLVKSKVEDASHGVPRISRGEALPLSFAQERLWFLDRLGRLGPAYHIGLAVRLKGPLDPAALSAALTEIVRRHEALRSRITTRDGCGFQRIDAPWPVELVAERVTVAQARSRTRTLMEAPFDLATDRLLALHAFCVRRSRSRSSPVDAPYRV
jgi:hypothetical protein